MQNQTIVVIDDEPFVLSLIETILEDEGFRVVTATDGKSGWEKIQAESPALVVTDIQMPGMNGIEVCKACEPLRQERMFPIFVLTGDTDRASKTWFKQLQNVQLVSKPFSPRQLVEQVHQALEACGNLTGQASDTTGANHG